MKYKVTVFPITVDEDSPLSAAKQMADFIDSCCAEDLTCLVTEVESGRETIVDLDEELHEERYGEEY